MDDTQPIERKKRGRPPGKKMRDEIRLARLAAGIDSDRGRLRRSAGMRISDLEADIEVLKLALREHIDCLMFLRAREAKS